ncbi:adhesin biosynthesis transcription regulatory family protein [Yersinia kristensenii]|uniref:adhesin biosynthesis transcription regulatory family protein n=1 Tax=Yersinia kristensenii TaxID=28152 RepID=UPI003896D8E3
MNEDYLFSGRDIRHSLQPGKISELHFWLLVEISSVHSEKVINALKDYFVLGYTRKEACERHNVSPSYFSGAVGRFQRLSMVIHRLIPFYTSEPGIYTYGVKDA